MDAIAEDSVCGTQHQDRKHKCADGVNKSPLRLHNKTMGYHSSPSSRCRYLIYRATLFVCPSTCLSVCLSVCLFACLLVCPSVCLLVCPVIRLPVCPCMPVHLYIYLLVHLFSVSEQLCTACKHQTFFDLPTYLPLQLSLAFSVLASSHLCLSVCLF